MKWIFCDMQILRGKRSIGSKNQNLAVKVEIVALGQSITWDSCKSRDFKQGVIGRALLESISIAILSLWLARAILVTTRLKSSCPSHAETCVWRQTDACESVIKGQSAESRVFIVVSHNFLQDHCIILKVRRDHLPWPGSWYRTETGYSKS